MLEKFSDGHLSSPIVFSKWSHRMDIIAVSHSGFENQITLYRMDWVKVQTLLLNSRVTLVSFSADGKNICISTESKDIRLFNIDNGSLISTSNIGVAATCISFGVLNDISIIAIGYEDNTVTIYSALQFSLSTIDTPQKPKQISIYGECVLILLEDEKTIYIYSVMCLIEHSNIIKTVSESVSNYFMHRTVLEVSEHTAENLWNKLWVTINPITAVAQNLVHDFVIGKLDSFSIQESSFVMIKDSVPNILTNLKNLFAEKIIPSTLSLIKHGKELESSFDISPISLNLVFTNCDYSNFVLKCFSVLNTISKFQNCFEVLFELVNKEKSFASQLEALESNDVSIPEFIEFLYRLSEKFSLLKFDLADPPESFPAFILEKTNEIILTDKFLSMNHCYVTTLDGNTVRLLTFSSDKRTPYTVTEHKIQGKVIVTHPFSSDGSVGCFYLSGDNLCYKMLGSDEVPRLVPGIYSRITISDRNIALIESDNRFFSIVDLSPREDDEEDDT